MVRFSIKLILSIKPKRLPANFNVKGRTMNKDLTNEDILSVTVAIPAIFYSAFIELVKQQGPVTMDLNVVCADKPPASLKIEIDRITETITFTEEELSADQITAQLESIGQEKH